MGQDISSSQRKRWWKNQETLDLWFLGILGLHLLPLKDLMDLLLNWRALALSAFGKFIWQLVLSAVYWVVWQERNNLLFKGYSEPAWQVYRRAKELILFWARWCKSYEGIPNGALLRHWDRIVGVGEE